MSAAPQFYATVDWRQPWYAPWCALGERVSQQLQAGCAVHEALQHVAPANGWVKDRPVKFVAQSALPAGQAYEDFIFKTKTVPTRDNLHDLFNGLAWLLFPQTKAKLNALQYAEIARHGVQDQRGALRDALTVFDENAAFLSTQWHGPVIDALRQQDWHAAFQTHRALLAAHPPLLFGHALLEKLAAPYKSITAHVFAVDGLSSMENTGGFASLAGLDARVAAQLAPTSLVPKPFAPLPVMGVPLWCAENEDAQFYKDLTVFRPLRASRS
jgi:hypothetical protein